MLETEFNYYVKHQAELVKLYQGKQLVIVGEKVVGAYDSLLVAYLLSENKYGLGKFLIQLCEAGEENYTVDCYGKAKFKTSLPMLIQEFLDLAVEKISKAFPQVTLHYQFDLSVNTHYLRVSPTFVFESTEFTDLYWELDDLFFAHFPTDTLCFLTEESLIQLENQSRIYSPPIQQG
jgi:hypothetical protein